MKKRISYISVVFAYFILNIFNTYFLTSNLNAYITSYKLPFVSHITAILGNAAILLFVWMIGKLIFKKEKWQALFLTFVTLGLNIAILCLSYYTKGYNYAFSIFTFDLMRNPEGGFTNTVVVDFMLELFVNAKILILIPFVVLLVLWIVFRNKFDTERKIFNWRLCLSFLILAIIVQEATYITYALNLIKNINSISDISQYGCQYAGVYNFYVHDILLFTDSRKFAKKEVSSAEVYEELKEFNKNINSYVNFIDGKTYSKYDKQTGIFKGYNIFVIQMESTMNFCYNASFNEIEVTPYFNNMDVNNNWFFFDNVYTDVGLGTTSDAEFAFMTGLVPIGDRTIAWDFYDYDFQIDTMGNYLDDYIKYSYNPTVEDFYNHSDVHENLYKMTEFCGVELFRKYFPEEENKDKYLASWVRDKAILEWACTRSLNANQQNKKCFSFVETITPHLPFTDLSSYYTDYDKVDFGIGNSKMNNYLNQIRYNDKLIYDFLMDVTNPASENYMENTLFILYGDHGNGIEQSVYEDLFGRELDKFEYMAISTKIPVFFYDPSGKLYNSMKSDDIEKICSMVKSERDLYRTILNLIGANVDSQYYTVNMFSGEPSYSYDPKNYYVYTDDFTYSMKKDVYITHNGAIFDKSVIDNISRYRLLQNEYILKILHEAPMRTED